MTEKERKYYLDNPRNLKMRYVNYYSGGIRLKTKSQLMEAIKLRLSIKRYDVLMDEIEEF